MAPGEEVSDPAAARARERRLGLGLRGLRRKKARLLPRYSTCGATVPAGTVHEMAARVGGGVGGAGSEDRDTR